MDRRPVRSQKAPAQLDGSKPIEACDILALEAGMRSMVTGMRSMVNGPSGRRRAPRRPPLRPAYIPCGVYPGALYRAGASRNSSMQPLPQNQNVRPS